MGLFSKKKLGTSRKGPAKLPEKYELIRELGRGSNGVVYLARKRGNENHPEVAIKMLECASETDGRKYAAILREVYVHKAAKHAHIVPVTEIFKTGSHVGIVMEYVSGGDLLAYVNRHGPLPESRARWIFQQLMYAVRHLHKNMHSMHRDIKLDNILVQEPSQAYPMVYLCDFSFAKTRGERHGATVSIVGSKDYTAPEILFRKEKTRYDGMVADIFSCGICLYIMLYGVYPKRSINKREEDPEYQISLSGISVDLAPQHHVGQTMQLCSLSAEVLELLAGLVTADPKKRISMEGIWAHSWFLKNLPEGARNGGD